MSEKRGWEGDNVVSLDDFRRGSECVPDGARHNETADVEHGGDASVYSRNSDSMDRAQHAAGVSAADAEYVLWCIRTHYKHHNRGGNDEVGNIVFLEGSLRKLLCKSMKKLAENLDDVLSRASEYKATIQHLSLSDRVKERLPQWLQDRIGYNALTLSLREVHIITTQLDTLVDGLVELTRISDDDERYKALELRNKIAQLQANIPPTPEQEWYDEVVHVVRNIQHLFEDRA